MPYSVTHALHNAARLLETLTMQNLDTLDLEENILARLDHDAIRSRWIFRLIDTDAGETITTRVYPDEASARAYFATWRNPLSFSVSITL